MRDSEALQYGKGSFRGGGCKISVVVVVVVVEVDKMLFDESVFWCSALRFRRFPRLPSAAGHL